MKIKLSPKEKVFVFNIWPLETVHFERRQSPHLWFRGTTWSGLWPLPIAPLLRAPTKLGSILLETHFPNQSSCLSRWRGLLFPLHVSFQKAGQVEQVKQSKVQGGTGAQQPREGPAWPAVHSGSAFPAQLLSLAASQGHSHPPNFFLRHLYHGSARSHGFRPRITIVPIPRSSYWDFIARAKGTIDDIFWAGIQPISNNVFCTIW